VVEVEIVVRRLAGGALVPRGRVSRGRRRLAGRSRRRSAGSGVAAVAPAAETVDMSGLAGELDDLERELRGEL
jgi:hypothetical protein